MRSLSREIRGLHQAAYLLAFLTLASQALALLRDRLFAGGFGAGDLLDLYYAAFKVPDLIFALIASLVSAYVLIPKIAKSNEEEARRILSHAASFLLITGGGLAALLAVFAPEILFFMFPSFADSPHADTFVLLSRLLLVQPILLGLSSVLTSVSQIHRRFTLFALSPVLYNLGIISGIVFLYPHYGLIGIGMGVLIGSVLHVAIHVPVASSLRLLPKLVVPDVRVVGPIMRDSIPRSLALGVAALSALILTAIAASTGDGGISVFTLAGNLAAVPLSLIGVSYATAAFPVLAREAGEQRTEAFTATFVTAARHLIFWSATALVLIIVLRAHIVRIIFGTGEFDWDATRLSAAILGILVVGLIAQGLVLLASRAFYAANHSWNPFFVQVGGGAIAVMSALGALSLSETYPEFVYFIEALFRVGDVPGASVLLVALGATIGQIAMALIALLTLKDVLPHVAPTLFRPILEGLGAAILGGASAYGVLAYMGNIAPLTTLLAVLTQALVAGIVGLAVSAAVLILLENREFRDVYEALRRESFAKRLPPLSEV
jgi:putative peptidoglycan lipid II flippase